MLNSLASHNEDINQLINKGHAVSVDSDYLVIRDVPYLDHDGALKMGAIISKLKAIDEFRVTLEDHQVFFCGSHPHQLDRTPIPNLGGGAVTLQLKSPDLVVERSFSNKPQNGFADLYQKIESYVTIISGPAMERFDITPYTYRTEEEISDSVFKLRDTLTSRAEIGDLVANFHEDIIAIIGLGGTGSYLLDFLVKTPVKEIRCFDLDWYHVHNAFRSPGSLKKEELAERKANVYQKRYENFRHGLNIHNKLVQADSEGDLKDVTFAFICVDKGSARTEIFDLLMRMKIPFIDVGMGLDRDTGPISATLRTTYFPQDQSEQVLSKRYVPLSDLPDDEYRNNIQISELNALNASIAIIKYKQLRGFYADDSQYIHSLFTMDQLSFAGEK